MQHYLYVVFEQNSTYLRFNKTQQGYQHAMSRFVLTVILDLGSLFLENPQMGGKEEL